MTALPRLGVIADTHGLLRPEAERCLNGVTHIVHAGDIGAPDVLTRLRRIAPVTAIKGNIDTHPWAASLRDTETVTIEGRTFHVLHNVKELKINPAERGIDVVISGHTHRVEIKTIDGVLYLNPGGAGRRRFSLPVTLATLEWGHESGLRPVVHQLDG